MCRPPWPYACVDLLGRQPGSPAQRRELLHDAREPVIRRELDHRGLITATGGYTARLVGWVELAAEPGGAEIAS